MKFVLILGLLLLFVIPFSVSAHFSVDGTYWKNASPCYDTDPLPSTYRSSADTAANRWNAVNADFEFKKEGLFDCGNDLYMEDMTDYEDANGIDVTAVTFRSVNSSDYITSADVYFDSKESWTTNTSNDLDFAHTATHEFGHWLFLYDLYDSSASDHMMYGYYTGIDSLHQHDKDGILFIYGPW